MKSTLAFWSGILLFDLCDLMPLCLDMTYWLAELVGLNLYERLSVAGCCSYMSSICCTPVLSLTQVMYLLDSACEALFLYLFCCLHFLSSFVVFTSKV